jgi:hypothetical protein
MANLRVDKITSTETFETTGSVQFDGTGDYLEVSDSSDWDFGTGPFTIECWVLMNPSTVGYSGIFGMHTGSTQFQFRINNVGTIQFLQDFGGTRGNIDDSDATGVNLRDSTWHHVAMVRQSDYSWQLYVDGKVNYSGTNMSGNVTGINEVAIGRRTDTNDYYLNGFISNMRVLNRAIYTENFKPSMRELEVIPGTVLLACQSKTDASLEKTGKVIEPQGNAVASELTPGLLTPVPKAGAGSAITGSVEFDGESILEATSPDFAMGDSDLTMECWFYNGVDTITHMVQIDVDGGATNFSLATRDAAAGDVRFLVRNDSGSNLSDLISGAPGAKINAWHHLAGTIEGTTTRLFLNGVLIKSGTISGTRTHTGDKLTLGANEANRYLKGYLSNVRIVRGTALYTKDFIPPTRELKKVPGTVLLCCQDPNNPLTEATGKTITGYGKYQTTDGVELVTNSTFDGNLDDWTVEQGTITYDSSTGTANMTGGSGNSLIQDVTTVIGKRYIMRAEVSDTGGTSNNIGIELGETGDLVFVASNTILTGSKTFSTSFTATSTSTEVRMWGGTGATGKWSYASLKLAEDPFTASNFTPQVGDDRKVTFEGVTKINSNAYFYLPTGDTITRESRYGRGLIVGGSNSNAIEYINITTLGNAQDYGDLTAETSYVGALASSTRGVYSRSRTPSSPSGDSTLEYSTLATTSNSVDFGNRTVAVYEVGALSNNTRGIIGGGYGPANSDVMDYVTIASTGDAIDFGNLTQARRGLNGLASPTRGCFAAGYQQPDTTTETDIIDYVTIASTGNALDFGNLIAAVWGPASLASPTRGIWAGGIDPNATNVINYVTISSTGNAQDFGDLSVAKGRNVGMSNSSRGVIGLEGLNTMDYITIATTGNTKDFGDLMRTVNGVRGGCSDSHGGLG